MRLLLLLALLLLPFGTPALAAGSIVVPSVTGAPDPFDAKIANAVADELVRLGYQATSEAEDGAVVILNGKANASRTPKGALFKINWSITDGRGGALGKFTSEITAPYDAQDPWDAFDADTLAKFAKAIARDTEGALKKADSKGAQASAAPRSSGSDIALLGGNARVFIKGVTGAPGDGNVALANALAQFFAQFDVDLLPARASDAYVIEAKVKVSPTPSGQDRVEILWLLETDHGKEIARIAQDNTVAKGSLNPSWGPVAIYAAEGAADGLLSVISQLGPVPPSH